MPIWTEEMKQRRKANILDRIMQDNGVSLDEANEIYLSRFRKMGNKGGKKTGASKVRGDKEYYSRISRGKK